MSAEDKLARIAAILAEPDSHAAPAAPQPVAGIQTPWGFKPYKDYPLLRDLPVLIGLLGRAMTDQELDAWTAATGQPDPRTHDNLGNPIGPGMQWDKWNTTIDCSPTAANGTGRSFWRVFLGATTFHITNVGIPLTVEFGETAYRDNRAPNGVIEPEALRVTVNGNVLPVFVPARNASFQITSDCTALVEPLMGGVVSPAHGLTIVVPD